MGRVDCQGEYNGNIGIAGENVLIEGVSIESMHCKGKDWTKIEKGAVRIIHKSGTLTRNHSGG